MKKSNDENLPLNKKGKPYNPEMHDADGKFVKGNKTGTHFIVRRYAEIRNLIHKSVSNEDVVKIVSRAVKDASNGDAEARRWLFECLIGKPKPVEEPLDSQPSWNFTINLVSSQQPQNIIDIKPADDGI